MRSNAVPPDDDAAAPTGVAAFLARVGHPIVELSRTLNAIAILGARTLRFVARGERRRGAVVASMYEFGNRSIVFLSVTMGALGMIMVYQAGLQAARIVPDYGALGPTYLQLLVRDLAASIGSLLLATRVGAGIAAEIGSMVVTEQVDALRMCAADPVDFLVVPRFLASVFMTAVVIVWAGAVATLTGALTAHVAFGVSLGTFIDPRMVVGSDVVLGLAKCVAYGAAIPLVSSHFGLAASGGSRGVGTATTRAVVGSSLAIIVLDLVLSSLGFVLTRS